jgi:hypothetical protein
MKLLHSVWIYSRKTEFVIMKNVVIYTNPFPESEKAVMYGILLARKLDMRAKLINVLDSRDYGYPSPQADSQSFPGKMSRETLLEKERKTYENYIQKFLTKNLSLLKPPPYSDSKVITGTLYESISGEEAKEENELIVLPQLALAYKDVKENDIPLHKITGCPVIVVPKDCEFNDINTITFAGHSKKEIEKAVEHFEKYKISDLAVNYHGLVAKNGDSKAKNIQLSALKDVEKGIKNNGEKIMRYALNNKSDLIIMLQEEKNVLEKFMDENLIKQTVTDSEIPVVVMK